MEEEETLWMLSFFLLRYARAKTTKNSLLPHAATHWVHCLAVGALWSGRLKTYERVPPSPLSFHVLVFLSACTCLWSPSSFPGLLLLLPLMCLLRLPELPSGLSSICLQLWSVSATALPAFSSHRFCPQKSSILLCSRSPAMAERFPEQECIQQSI